MLKRQCSKDYAQNAGSGNRCINATFIVTRTAFVAVRTTLTHFEKRILNSLQINHKLVHAQA